MNALTLDDAKLTVDILNLAAKAVKGLDGLSATAREAKLRDLGSQVLAAQQSAFAAYESKAALLERVNALEAELVRLKDWEAEKQRYKPDRIEPGTLVYVLKQEFMKAGEPAAMLCQPCYDNGQRGIFNVGVGLQMGNQIYKCSVCGAQHAFDYSALHARGLA